MDVAHLSTPRQGSPTITLNIYGHLFGNTDDRADVIERAFGKVLAAENPDQIAKGTN
ncbi:MAG: hypothetical protein WCF47_13120 [Pseudolabrys sp.]